MRDKGLFSTFLRHCLRQEKKRAFPSPLPQVMFDLGWGGMGNEEASGLDCFVF